MGRVIAVVVVLGVALTAGGCITDSPEEAEQGPVSRFTQQPAWDGPSVEPARCRPDIPTDGLAVPNVDAVARTSWRLERVGSCRVPPDADRPPTLGFMEGWASAPAECNEQGAPFQVDGRRFRLVESGSMTAADCPSEPMGYLEAITSWGIAQDDRLYLLDADDLAVFVARPLGEPGCVIRRGNGMHLAANGTDGCDTSGMDNDLRE